MLTMASFSFKSLFGFNSPARSVVKDKDGKFFYAFGFPKTVQDTVTIMGQSSAYNICPAVNGIINRKARAFTNGKWWILDKEGNEATGSAASKVSVIQKLLKRPNPLQNWNQFMAQAKVYEQVYGEVFIFSIIPAGFTDKTKVKALWVVPNWIINVKLTGKHYFQTELDDIIEGYDISINGSKTDLPKGSVIHIRDINQNSTDVIRGQSRLASLQDPISNIIAAYEARNVLITRKGALGILSNQTRDAAGAVPLKDTDKDEVQNDFRKYGLGKDQYQVIITNANLKWQPMTFPTRDLMLFEEIEDDVRQIADNFDYPMYLLGFKAGSTFSNVGEAKKSLYQDTIIPEAEGWAEVFTTFFELEDIGLRLSVYYDHLDVFQQSEKEKADALLSKVNANLPLLEKNLITLNQFMVNLDFDNRGTEGDKYLSEIQSMPLAVKLGVGGTQAMQAILADTNIPDNRKRQILIILFGMSEQDANAIMSS
jgi:phage portal protein BeeE